MSLTLVSHGDQRFLSGGAPIRDFDYFLPHSLEEALSLLDSRRHARILAGGTDLIAQMKEGRIRPSAVIDVKRIPELNRLTLSEGGELFVGAAVPLNQIIGYPPVKATFPMLFEACSLVGSLQLRNRASLGGNICNAAPSADTAPSLLSLSAQALLAGPGGTRSVPIADFFTGPGMTVLSGNEILLGVKVPCPSVPSAGAYLRHIPRQEMDIAVAGVATFLSFGPDNICMEAKVGLGAVAPTPMRAFQAESILSGRALTDESIDQAAVEASGEARPISDIRASASYRREIVRVLTRRSLKTAWQRYLSRDNGGESTR